MLSQEREQWLSQCFRTIVFIVRNLCYLSAKLAHWKPSAKLALPFNRLLPERWSLQREDSEEEWEVDGTLHGNNGGAVPAGHLTWELLLWGVQGRQGLFHWVRIYVYYCIRKNFSLIAFECFPANCIANRWFVFLPAMRRAPLLGFIPALVNLSILDTWSDPVSAFMLPCSFLDPSI